MESRVQSSAGAGQLSRDPQFQAEPRRGCAAYFAEEDADEALWISKSRMRKSAAC